MSKKKILVTIKEVTRKSKTLYLLIYSCEWTPTRFVEDLEPQPIIPQ